VKVFWPILIVVIAAAAYAVYAAMRQTKQLREQVPPFVEDGFLSPFQWEQVRAYLIEEYEILLQWVDMGTIKWNHEPVALYDWKGPLPPSIGLDDQFYDVDATKADAEDYSDGVLYFFNRKGWVIAEYHFIGKGKYELVIHQYEAGCHLRVCFSDPHRQILWIERAVEANEIPQLWERSDQKGIARENYVAYHTNNEQAIERTFAAYHQGQLLDFKPRES